MRSARRASRRLLLGLFAVASLQGLASKADEPPAAATPAPRLGVLEFAIRDETGATIPGRLTFVRESDPELPFRVVLADARFAATTALRQNVIYTRTGRGRVAAEPGRYRVYASRGIEWSIDSTSVLLSAGVEREFLATLRREVDSSGFIGADLHVHTATHSKHGDADVSEQLLALVGEGVEFAVASEHNHNASYRSEALALGVGPYLQTVTGNEVSTLSGHWTVFPQNPERRPVHPQDATAELFAGLRGQARAAGEDLLIQVNHPRSTQFPYFSLQSLDPVTGVATGAQYAEDFDLIEVMNANAAWGYFDSDPLGEPPSAEGSTPDGATGDVERAEDRPGKDKGKGSKPGRNGSGRKGARTDKGPSPGGKRDDGQTPDSISEPGADGAEKDAKSEKAAPRRPIGSSRHSVLRDWFNLLDRGHRYSAVGNSDSHQLGIAHVPGIPRNFIASETDEPARVTHGKLYSALRAGKSFTTTGPFISASVGSAGPGDETHSTSGEVELHVRVQAASWIAVDRVKLIVNGDLVDEIEVDATTPAGSDETEDGAALGSAEGAAGRATDESTQNRSGVRASRPVVRLDRRIPLKLTGDSWIVVLAEGDAPLSPIVVPSERPALPLAVANPIRVRVGAGAETRERWSSPWEQALERATSSVDELERALAADQPPVTRARMLLAIAEAQRPDAARWVTSGLLASGEEARPVRLAAARAVEQLEDPGFQSALDEAWPAAGDDPYLRVALLRAYAATDTDAFRSRLMAQLDAGDRAALTRSGRELSSLWPEAFVRDWSVLGYFPNPSPQTLTRRNFGPEVEADATRRYPGKQGQEIGWRDAQASAAGFLDLSDLAERSADPLVAGSQRAQPERAIAYAQVYLYAPDRRSVAFALGSDDGTQVYLNGSVIYQDSTRHAANPWQHFGRLRLRRGWNRLLFKVENGVGDFGLYFQLFDSEVRSARAPE